MPSCHAAACKAACARTKEIYADLIPQVVAMRRSGMSGNDVAEELNRNGQRNQRGGPWTHGTVYTMLKREGLNDINAVRRRRNRERDGIQPFFNNRARVKAAYAGIIPIVCEMYATQNSTRYIADWLNQLGYRTINWNPWTTDAVVSLLRVNDQTIRQRDLEEKRVALQRAQANTLVARSKRVHESYSRAHPLAMKLRKQGRTLAETAEELNRRNVATPNGKSWHPVSIAQLLRWRPS